MKKQWLNPELKNLEVSATETATGWIVCENGDRINADLVSEDAEPFPEALGVKYGFECPCCGFQSGYIYDTARESKKAYNKHMKDVHPNGVGCSA